MNRTRVGLDAAAGIAMLALIGCSDPTASTEQPVARHSNIVRASGVGTIVLACFGALDVWDLAPGETFVLDTTHMVAYDESVQYKLRRAVEGRSIQSMKSGEGWVFEFTGPGKVYGQTRSPQSLTKWLESTLTLSNSSPTGGALGSLLSR